MAWEALSDAVMWNYLSQAEIQVHKELFGIP